MFAFVPLACLPFVWLAVCLALFGCFWAAFLAWWVCWWFACFRWLVWLAFGIPEGLPLCCPSCRCSSLVGLVRCDGLPLPSLRLELSEAFACPLWLVFVPLACVACFPLPLSVLACVGCPEGFLLGFRAVVPRLSGVGLCWLVSLA